MDMDHRLKYVEARPKEGEGQGGGTGSGSKKYVSVKRMEPQTVKNAKDFRRWRDSMENYARSESRG